MKHTCQGQSICGAFLATLAISIVGCGSPDAGSSGEDGALSGTIRIDGSSTVFPISAVAAELFEEENPGVSVSVSQSGTSSGMGKFLLKEIDICDASRPIKDSEIEKAKEAGIEFLEFTVALDGIAVVVNPQNDWCDEITVEQLKTLWEPEADGTIMQWSQVNSDWPEEDFKLYGPGTASGTFEYFTEAICHTKKASRPDYTPSENDNMLVRGVAGDKGALGYFGLAYYEENAEQLKLLGVDGGDGPIKPSEETVKDGRYAPLSRPLFIYVNTASLKRPEIAAFLKFYLDNAADMSVKAKYVEATEAVLDANREALKTALGG